MTGYRRNAVPGGSFFFTVNLADRRLRLLTERIDLLRAQQLGVYATEWAGDVTKASGGFGER